jgi:hypothetical protein
MEMAVRSMETAETAMETDGDGFGGTSPSRQGPEQRLLSPEIHRWRRQSCGTISRKLPIPLGFSVLRLLIGEGRCQEWGQAPSPYGSVARPLAVRAWRVGPWWPPSYSPSDLWKLLGKIRLQELVSSNSENISCVSLLKHKNSRKLGIGTVATC